MRGLADAGLSAVVMYSLFEEQIRGAAEAGSETPEHYLEQVERAAMAVDITIIASLDGSSRGTWPAFARRLEEAGAATARPRSS